MNIGYPTLGDSAIPGDPDGLSVVASRLAAARDQVSSVQGRVASNGLQGTWSGSAGDAFRSSLNLLPGELGSVAGAFDLASSAIGGFAGRLAGFQEQAAYFGSRIQALEEELAAAQHRHDEAQNRVRVARLREDAAHDPVSLKTAVDAVRYGLGLLQQALNDLDEHSQEITRLRGEAQANREDYESAVQACCAQLQDASESSFQGHGSSHISVSSIIGGIGMFWARSSRRIDGDAEDVVNFAGTVYGDADSLDQVVEGMLPVSSLGRWAVPIVDVASNPVFEGAGHVFTALGVYEDGRGLMTTWDQTRGEKDQGRVVTMVGSAATDAVIMRVPVVGVANLLDGGALNASGQGLSLILGGAASGGLKGALQGDDQFADNAANGEYGGFVKDMAKGEDYLIEHPGNVAHAVVHADEYAAKDVVHVGVSAVKDVGDAGEDAAKGAYHGVTHLLSDL
jgi:uncharacterized protein YukE